MEALDFLVSEIAEEEEHPVFFIELKTGPSQPEDMKEFQLDVNDFNDIATVARRWQTPVYVFHIQVVEEYRLPTRRSIAKNLWWTDIFTLREHLKAVKRRRGEDKDAGYYEPKAFKSIQTFVAELQAKRYKELRDRLLEEGIPSLPGRNA